MRTKHFTAREFKVVAIREMAVSAPLLRCDCPETAGEYWLRAIASAPGYFEDREALHALHLNAKRRVTGHHLVGIGTVNCVLVHPRDVFRGAIVHNAHAVVLVHNHPSGDVLPSVDDMRVTLRLRRIGKIVGIDVLDHIIVGRKPRRFSERLEICSLRKAGCFSKHRKAFRHRDTERTESGRKKTIRSL